MKSIKNLPNTTTLVTMDVSSLYTNIDHNEGTEACYKKLQTRPNKSILFEILKKFIVIKSNIFKFGCDIYKQIKGVAMGTPLAPNFVNIFMDNLENRIIQGFYNKAKLKPLIWLQFIDDICFIWIYDDEILKELLIVQTILQKKIK